MNLHFFRETEKEKEDGGDGGGAGPRKAEEGVWIISQGRNMFMRNYSLTSHAHPIYVCDFDSLVEKNMDCRGYTGT